MKKIDPFSIVVVIFIIAGLYYTYRAKAYLTHTLVLVNIIIFMMTYFVSDIILDLGFRPEYLFTGEKIYTVITSMYLHSGVLHLFFNMIFLIFIGLLFEEKIGTLRFGIIYYVTGFAAVVTFSFTSGFLRPEVIVVGASGGLYGILGAYARLYPDDRFAFIPFPYPLPIYTWAFIFLLIAIVATFVPGICFGPIAHLAHVGGLFAGLAVSPLVMKIKGKEKERVTKIDYNVFDVLAQTDSDKELLEKIKNEDEPEVRIAWLEHFLSKAKCPQCGGILQVEKRKLKCTCGFELKF
ncbi:MAG: rhomboid family intramembrane serine protease [Thermoplasmata archaeon]|nr:MAG: rhomboid family intramembrane serine protease [Thermoplasmata archaeon]